MRHTLFHSVLALMLCAPVLALATTYTVGLTNAYQAQYGQTHFSIPIDFPLDFHGTLINWSKAPKPYFPDRFVLSNGSTLRTFIEIDKRPGSRLKAQIDEISVEIISSVNKKNKTDVEPSEVLNYLTQDLHKHMAWITRNGSETNFSWDKNLTGPGSVNFLLASKRKSLINHSIGTWIETDRQHYAVPFENIVELKKGLCLDMVLLASFLLENFNISHQVVFGSVLSGNFVGQGHTWIELSDGRILDVAWNTLDYPQFGKNPGNPNWIWFGNEKGFQYRYPYAFFPIISL